jgi:Beta-propeller domains of methanol dehydrogenase type
VDFWYRNNIAAYLKKALSLAALIVVFFMSGLSSYFFFKGSIFADVTYPDYSSFVNDYTGTLDSGGKSSIEDLCVKVESETNAEIAVAIVSDLQGITIEEYAASLFEKWGVGKADKDNGVLLLVSMQEKKVKIEVGYGLEGAITDLEAGNIINDIIVPGFKQGDYNAGVYNGVYAIAGEIYKDQGLALESTTAPQTTGQSGFGDLFNLNSRWCNPFFICCIPIFLIVALISVIKGILNRRCPKCRKIKLVIKETVVREATYTSSGEKLVERTCSYCGYYDKKLVTTPKKVRSSGGGFIGGFGGGSGGGGGGFGGFGGGSSGGGGASGGW